MPGVPTMADVARACGLSVATVSKALNPHADRCDIADATRAAVQAAAQRLGYRRDGVKSLNRRLTYHNLGLAWARHAPRVAGVYEYLIENAAEVARELGFHLLFTPLPGADGWRQVQLSQKLDGVLVIESMHDQVVAELEASQYPAVLINFASPRQVDQILVDEALCAERMVAHLHGLGHRRIVYLPIGMDWHYCDSERSAGLQRAAQARGMSVQPMARDAPAAVARACAGAGCPTAVVAFQDTDVVGLYAALGDAGLAVPGDVSVACIGDASWFTYIRPRVTAVEVPINDMVRLGVRRVSELIAAAERSPPRCERLAGMLAHRDSTGPAPKRRRRR